MTKCKLGDLLDVTRGVSLSGEHYATSGDKIRLTLANFDYVNNCFKDDDGKDNLFYDKAVPDKFILEEGRIITPLTEQTPGLLGSTARIPQSGTYIHSQDVGLISPIPEKLDSDFAFYLVSSKGVKEQLGARSQQTKIRHTSPDKIKDCTVFVPKIDDQRKIGKFLSSIDRLIQLSRKRIVELEKMAKEIYDYWFVQFDFPDKNGRPYKSTGGKMVYNSQLKRDIPEGWEVKRFGDLVSIEEEQVNPQKLGDEMLEYYSIPAFDDGCYPSFENASAILSSKFKVGEGALLVSKLNPQFQRIWDPLRLSNSAICSTEFIVCKCEEGMRALLFEIAKSTTFQEFMVQRSSSSTGSRKRIDPQEILSFDFAMPSGNAKSIECFNRIVSGFLGMIRESRKMIKQLTTLREFLLPLLMNGQAKMGGTA